MGKAVGVDLGTTDSGFNDGSLTAEFVKSTVSGGGL